jgi:hypothetical protein
MFILLFTPECRTILVPSDIGDVNGNRVYEMAEDASLTLTSNRSVEIGNQQLSQQQCSRVYVVDD